jgi:hypothetical protein
MERQLAFIPGGIVGFVENETGVALALRNNGDEVLFASRENAPLRWVQTTDFTPDPKGIWTVEDAMAQSDDEEED